jgi:hypothetical protein
MATGMPIADAELGRSSRQVAGYCLSSFRLAIEHILQVVNHLISEAPIESNPLQQLKLPLSSATQHRRQNQREPDQ